LPILGIAKHIVLCYTMGEIMRRDETSVIWALKVTRYTGGSMKRPRIMVVDDDPGLTDLLQVSLRFEGYKVGIAPDGVTALAFLPRFQPALIILDLVMPGPDGFAVLEHVRRNSDVPILVLSAKHSVDSKVRALNGGADDYLTKPFEMEELIARVKALLRRAAHGALSNRTAPQRFGHLCIEPQKRCVTLRGERLHLTPTEYALLVEFASQPDEVLSRTFLLQRVWGPEYRTESNYLHVYVQRLRSKIEDDPANPRYIVTVPGVGYRFCPDAAATAESAAG